MYIALGVLAFLLIVMIANKFSKSKKWCNIMGWHKAPVEQNFNGQFTGTCPRCDKKVIRDSQGNWF